MRGERPLRSCPNCGSTKLRLRSEVIAYYDARIINGKVSWESNRLVLVNPDRSNPKASIWCLDCLTKIEKFEILGNGTVILR